ncbi:AAA family ATPase [Xenorhabdus hominickii]|uniref:Poly polymerase n=1 Tax=Xenorhabdus hominickii TaxID=351679 RepID=A0A2G0Q4L4_XENHO|nr:AAA family ATPase [Xenorhabdus hominickii]AOM42440.1 poly(A) polymerase [Xenorhabdus hominickii]PHM54155.1 poly polymerase [Xenorhabdus hominickii]
MSWVFSRDKSWDYLSSTFSFIADMDGVQQDLIHHAEGDVALHTQMVLSALEQMPEYSLLTAEEQEILWTAALLHDVEKRSTTRADCNGRIISPGHARKGELTARQILFQQIPVPFAIREQIAALVRFHGLPLWLMEKPNPQKALLAASLRVDTYLLTLLAKADVLGRTCHDAQELLERIELFELYCHEQLCWREPREFSSGEARFHYFSSDSEQPNYQPYDDYGSQVTLLCGLPGMGKDHFIQQQGKGVPVVSLDAIRREYQISPEDKNANGWVVQQAKQQAREKLRNKQDFIWNATNLTAQMRQQLVKLFVSYNARVRIVYIEQDYKLWRQQNSHRQYAVPDKVLDRMLGKLEVPTPEEAHEVCYFIDSMILNR